MVRLRDPDTPGKKGYAGELVCNGVTSPAIRLWMDTAPEEWYVAVASVRQGGELWISNCWRHADGGVDEWLNNYGMLIEERSPGSYLLRCSDGYGLSLTPTDLVIEVEWIRSDLTTEE